MSTTADNRPIGRRSFDLSTARGPGEQDYELVRLPRATFIAVENVDAEAYLHLGDESAPGLDMRQFNAYSQSKPIGQMYVENPSASAGDTLDIVFGAGELEVSIDAADIEASISGYTGGTVPTEEQGEPLDVSGATVSVQEDTALDVSGATVSVQEDTALDVSGGTVTITEASALDVSEQNVQPWGSINTGQESVSTAGTSEQLNGGTSLTVPEGGYVQVNALTGNAGPVYIGDSTVDASTGYQLPSNRQTQVPVDDVSDIYVDADNDGDGVSWMVVV